MISRNAVDRHTGIRIGSNIRKCPSIWIEKPLVIALAGGNRIDLVATHNQELATLRMGGLNI